ncbi:transporter [uncultured Robinsoniella sp.]|uniref:transporter n=1 Tax=uncultured Robinsoniella sp. TaxID=904190 RepID=UPI00374F1B24
MKKKYHNLLFRISYYMELFLAILITAAILILSIHLIPDVIEMATNAQFDNFNNFLSTALSLVVGIEFVKMLCKHTPETLIEVLMFATARQMVVEHMSLFESTIGIIAIGILFFIKKFLLSNFEPGKEQPGSAEASPLDQADQDLKK